MKREAVLMEPFALAICVKALDGVEAMVCEEADVLAMCESGDLSFALQAAQVLATRQKNATNATAYDDDHVARFFQALLAGLGYSRFTTGELMKWIESAHGSDSRTALRAARALCQVEKDADLTVQMLGMQLARLARIDGARLVRDGEIRGSAVWRLRDLRD